MAGGPRNLVEIFSVDCGIQFKNLTALDISSPFVFYPQTKTIVDLIQRFPHVASLSIPITRELINEANFKAAAMRLDKLETFTFGIRWPSWVLDAHRADLSTLWGIINTNSESLRSLRINLYECSRVADRPRRAPDPWPPKIWHKRGAFLVRLMLLRPPSSLSQYFFPTSPLDWPNKLSLKLFQLQEFSFCVQTGLGNKLSLLNLEALEAFSLLVSGYACSLVNEIATDLVNLRYLQLDDPFVPTTLFARLFRRLPRPLEALYLTIPKPDQDLPFELTWLGDHQQSLRHLALVYVAEYTAVTLRGFSWDYVSPENPLVLAKPDFTGFTRLETLELSFGRIHGGLVNLALPPTLKFLDIEDHESDDILTIGQLEGPYHRLFRGYVRKQCSSSDGLSKASLEAMVVHRGSNIIFLARLREESLRGGNGRVTTISRNDFKQRFPDFSERYCQFNVADYRWKWIERFV
ncbi:hypothetical protein TWF192_004144 [Orbilia oligospora]|uniref:Uncharacterized protein n=1 Tax=Orbilia oligospora TaxID=2813651 RepID=A0A6G1MQ37_ORBOL|nr:hypothetical protein TWF679_007316 [Orbilia oligospora]KAF3216228.1 hypothetical protein TWF191_009059 [Orbilia oligospora]KAF3264462.1 hypothetical protein TWF192_004144 [Orbilia oligospora]